MDPWHTIAGLTATISGALLRCRIGGAHENCVQPAYRRHQSKCQTSYILKHRKILHEGKLITEMLLKIEVRGFRGEIEKKKKRDKRYSYDRFSFFIPLLFQKILYT